MLVMECEGGGNGHLQQMVPSILEREISLPRAVQGPRRVLQILKQVLLEPILDHVYALLLLLLGIVGRLVLV